MKKYFLVGIAAIAAVAAINVNLGTKSNDLSDISLANVEALADENSDDCNYTNGYRKFDGSDGGAYDCCKKWKNGSASNDCH
jgi:hypothetical protein